MSNCDDTAGTILFYTIRFDKEVELYNCAETILEGKIDAWTIMITGVGGKKKCDEI